MIARDHDKSHPVNKKKKSECNRIKAITNMGIKNKTTNGSKEVCGK